MSKPVRWIILIFGLVMVSITIAKLSCAPQPAGPSKDSAATVQYIHELEQERELSRQRDAQRRLAFDSLMQTNTDLQTALRKARKNITDSKPPTGTASDSSRYWQTRAESSESLLQVAMSADSIVIDSLKNLFLDQQRESARLRTLVNNNEDTLAVKANTIARLERRVRSLENGSAIGISANASYAGGCWTTVGGIDVARKKKVLFVDTELSAVGGVGAGGCGRLPDDIRQVEFGPAAQVKIKVSI